MIIIVFLEVAKTELRDDIYLQTRETDSDYPMFLRNYVINTVLFMSQCMND